MGEAMSAYEAAGRVIGSVPQALGYRPNDGQVAVLVIDREAVVQGAAVLDSQAAASISDAVDQLERVASRHEEPTLMFVGYGLEGRGTAAALQAECGDREIPTIATAVIDGKWSELTASREWAGRGEVPDMASAAVFNGRIPATKSYDELRARYEPFHTPTFAPLDKTQAALLDGEPPSFRAEVAVRTLDAIAASRVDEPGRQAIVAHLAGSSTWVRDNLIVHASTNDATRGALVDMYRGAPEEYRPRLATITGAAMYASGRESNRLATEILDQGDGERLAKIIGLHRMTGSDSAVIRNFVAGAVTPEGAKAADSVWNATRSMNATSHAAPSPASDPLHRLQQRGPEFGTQLGP